MTVGADNGDAEVLRIDPGKLRNVMRDGAAIGALAHLGGDVGDDAMKVGHWAILREWALCFAA